MSFYNHKGYNLYYKIIGKGKPLLILHGNTTSSLMLEEEANFYSKFFRVVIVDIIGHGRSDRLKEFPLDYWNENTKILKGLCEQLGINKVNLLGTSGGAIIALNFAINYSEMTSRVIADSFIGGELSLKEVISLKEEREIAKKNSGGYFWKSMHGEDWETVIDSDTNMLINYAKTFGNNFHNKLNKIECPVLVTGSLSDNLIDNIHEKMCNVAKKIRQSTTIFSPGGEHPLMLSKRTFFRKIAINFLKEDTLIYGQ